MVDKDQILQRIKDSVKSTAPDATLILYGSYARGDYREDSDIDLLVLLNKDKVTIEDRMQIISPVYGIELDTGKLISLFFYSKKAWETRKMITPFYENVTREGIVL